MSVIVAESRASEVLSELLDRLLPQVVGLFRNIKVSSKLDTRVAECLSCAAHTNIETLAIPALVDLSVLFGHWPVLPSRPHMQTYPSISPLRPLNPATKEL